MAVTGLPHPQPDHAYRMAKFAVDCQAKTMTILHQLKDSLGEDTATLTCRIGMHSGPGTSFGVVQFLPLYVMDGTNAQGAFFLFFFDNRSNCWSGKFPDTRKRQHCTQ